MYEVEYLERKGGKYEGLDWKKFQTRQLELLNAKETDGWELVQVVPLTGQGGLGAAASSTTAGLLYYFRK